jgi:hypothetical protein
LRRKNTYYFEAYKVFRPIKSKFSEKSNTFYLFS